MFERFKQRNTTVDHGRGATAVGDGVDDDTAVREGNGRTLQSTDNGPATAETMRNVRARQREEYGGINWGAAFFGWLVAVGVAVLLTGILAAAGAAIGLTEPSAASKAQSEAETLSFAGAIALLVVLAIAYYCGGYVAGRMSRFDGARQGIGAWIIGLVVTIAIAALAIVLGSEYNVIERANLPRLPIGDQQSLTTGGAIASLVLLAGTLLFSALGGIAGARYHRKVDRAGFVD
jgi:hypothetical protein